MTFKKLFKIHFTSSFLIIIFGSLLHFLFQISGRLKFIALFAPVNESVWEHLKLGFWPIILYYLFLGIFFKKKINNFIFALLLELLIFPGVIIFLFYFYTFLLGRNILFIDILIFILAVFLAQYLGYKLLLKDSFGKKYQRIFSWIILLFFIFIYFFFTFYPPHFELFKDPITQTYGFYQEK